MVQSTLSKPTQNQQRSLSSWFYQLLQQPKLKVKTQQRGNALHLLLEGQDCPDKIPTLLQLVEQLQLAPLDDRFAHSPAPVYRLLVYGRQRGQSQPRWSQSLQLNQLDRYQRVLAQKLAESSTEVSPEQAETEQTETASIKPEEATQAWTDSGVSALILSNRALAQQGDPDAIARYLSEELNGLGVSVRVAIKAATPDSQPAISIGDTKRLWVLCETAYSLDASATANVLATRLRGLELDGFQDAAVFSQVKGELKPDWSLRVDLTPPDELQRQWSRWGDEAAIALLLQNLLQPQGLAATTQLQGSTLHLFCRPTTAQTSQPALSPLRDQVAPLLIELAPQGIHGVALYNLAMGEAPPAKLFSAATAAPQNNGSAESPAPPANVEWIALPASEHPELAPSTLDLAEQGDLSATSFLLTRLLNPDLEEQLQTGGTRVQLLRRGDLLHIMCDAPRCPRRKTITRPVSKYIRRLRLPKVAGLRIYGRRAGQAQPRWQYGRDFVPRQNVSGEIAPRFKVTEAKGGDLLTQDSATMADGIGQRRAPWNLGQGIALPGWNIGPLIQPWIDNLHQGLVQSQFFIPQGESSLELAQATVSAEQDSTQLDQPSPQSLSDKAFQEKFGATPAKVALIWAALGLVLTGGTDLVLGQVLTLTAPRKEAVDLASSPNALGEVLLGQGAQNGDDTGNSSFLDSSEDGLPLGLGGSLGTAPRPTDSPAINALMEQYPSFNNPLFNEKLAIYRQRVAEEGPPDILVMGSSRALRGVDPEALAAGLGKIGKPDLKVFNFSINGSTAQVVELQLLMLLEPETLPGIIVWADGARAFNSGRNDRTYEAIAESEAYRRLLQNTLPALFTPGGTMVAKPLQARRPITSLLNIQGLDNALDNTFSRISAVHGRRAQLKNGLGKLYARSASGLQPEPDVEAGPIGHALDVPEGEGFIDFDGFMPLSVRFNPATYYQTYSRVTGEYDKDYQGFRMDGDQTRSLDTIIHLTQQYGIPLVFVNLPLTQEYLDPVRSRYESLFQKQMFKRMTQRQLIFRDLSQLWPDAVDNFSDPSHLNRYGARRVSAHLAEDPMIPWPSLPRR